MSSFNWFNRQYDAQSAEPGSEAEPSGIDSSDAAEAAPGESTEAAPAIAQDVLAWAKIAQQNIQKRKAEAAAKAAAAAPVPDIDIDIDTAAANSEHLVAAIASPEATSPDAPPALPETQPETQPDSEAEPEAAVLPFWARAEAERQERLERLNAEALATAEPEVSPETALEPTDVGLDENFLWSAQVLAAQGRQADQVDLEEITWLNRLRQGLDKTRRSLINQLRSIVGQGPLNQDAVLEIESLLLQADVGVAATDYIIEALQSKLRQEALPPDEAIAYLKEILRGMLDNPGGKPIDPSFAPDKGSLNIWLMTGVNGAGKTTTIGKIAHIAQKSGYKTLIGAADTFRAAAVQQVKVWGDRSNVDVISNPGKNTDPAAVVFDAITAAQARHTELLLLDTAGRLQNKKNLMDELSKIRRIIDKKAPEAHIESLLVLDATLGQNGLRQAEVFAQAAQLSGVVLTKLDGTAKGGIVLAVVQQLGLPIRFIGAGEGIEDLRPFSSYEFVEALLSG